MGISRAPEAPRSQPTSAIFFTRRSQNIVIISEGFFIFSLLSLQGPRTAASSAISRAFLHPSLLPKSSNFFFFLKWKPQSESIRHGTHARSTFPPSEEGVNCPNPASAASQTQIEHKPELPPFNKPHMSNFFPPVEIRCQICCHSHSRRGLRGN